MKALVVYESMFGNTLAVATAIAGALGEAELLEVADAPAELPADVDLLVVGGPTHVHGMSREKTREDAALRVDRPLVSRGDGVREWAAAVRANRAVAAAAFDTRVPGPELFTGAASNGIAKLLKGRGLRVLGLESFVLDGAKGQPFDRVPPEELDRARAWARSLGDRVAEPIR